MVHSFLVIFEKAGSNFSAYCPDLPGCIATGATVEETRASIHEAIQMHLAGMAEDGEAVPQSETSAERIMVAV